LLGRDAVTKKRSSGAQKKVASAVVSKPTARLALIFLLADTAIAAASSAVLWSGSHGRREAAVGATPLPVRQSPGTAVQASYEVVKVYPHDPQAFLQGLLYHDGKLYESTGLNGRSSLRRVKLKNGKVQKLINIPQEYFAEGLAVVDDRLVQLTWQSRRGFVYNLKNFKMLRDFRYESEGWGITYDGTNLVMSDGSDTLTYLDPQTFEPVRRLAVTMNGRPLVRINELEFIEGEIWANVWLSDMIVRIAPATGEVTSFLDLTGILTPDMRTGGEDVLNGIAYDAQGKRIFVSGKLWPRLFEIRLK
jgi:glutamine cyclotransferase